LVSVLPARARTLDITEFDGEAMSVSTLSSAPSSEHSHSSSGDLGAGMQTPSTAAPTMGHSSSGHFPGAYSAAGHAAYPQSVAGRTARTEDGHNHGSVFAADSPFESESPLHWQDEPALADSRPTSLDAVSPVRDSAADAPVYEYGMRGSTLLAYDTPEVLDPRNAHL
jgi:hypothetical protein